MKILKNYPYVPYGCELTDRMVDARRTEVPWNFIAFSEKIVPEIGPAVRFYGGTPSTGISACAPSLGFDIFGNCEVIIGDWMNEANCSNAFDENFIKQVIKFVQKNLPVLCLLQLGKLSLADAVDYFSGRDRWNVMLSAIRDVPDGDYVRLQYAADPYDLHKLAFEMGIYKKLCGEMTMDDFSKNTCRRLKPVLKPEFEVDWGYHAAAMITQYNGFSRCVSIPEEVELIDEGVFAGHSEIEQVRFSKGCRSIGYCAFTGCNNLQKLLLPESCDHIGRYAFADCSGLKFLLLPPNGIIESGAFSNCAQLDQIDIPEGISYIGEDAFSGCTNLIIRCKENSCAHKYAQEHGISFVVL